jgi:hypothetical protein
MCFIRIRIKIIYEHLAKIIFWNMILRMILEGYIEYAISSILNVKDVSCLKFAEII